MSTSSQLSDFSHLSVSERMLVVEQIWDSIAAEQTSLPLTPAQRDELDNRLAAASPIAERRGVLGRCQGTHPNQ